RLLPRNPRIVHRLGRVEPGQGRRPEAERMRLPAGIVGADLEVGDRSAAGHELRLADPETAVKSVLEYEPIKGARIGDPVAQGAARGRQCFAERNAFIAEGEAGCADGCERTRKIEIATAADLIGARSGGDS